MQIFKRDNKYLSTSTWSVYETSITSYHNQSCHPFVLLLSFLCQLFNFLPLSFLFFFFFFFSTSFLRPPSSFVVWILILPLERLNCSNVTFSLQFFFFFLPPLTLFSREYSSVLLIWKLFHARILKHLSRIFDYLSMSFFFSFFFIKSMLLRVNSFVVHFFAPLETVYKRNTVHLVISRGGERIKLTISLLFSPWNIPFTI